MSKFGLTTGLIISVMLHIWLLGGSVAIDSKPVYSQKLEQMAIVDVVEIEQIPQSSTEVKTLDEPRDTQKIESKEKPAKEQQKQKSEVSPPKEPEPLPLASSRKPLKSESMEKGDFAGNEDGKNQPVLRINWGTIAGTEQSIKTGKMKLVTLGPGNTILNEVKKSDKGKWQRMPIRFNAADVYSDCIRVVDRVPAFQQLKSNLPLNNGEKLAVLVPVSLEKKIEQAKLIALANKGLGLKDVEIFGGRFAVNGSRIFFEIDKIQKRRRP